MVSTDNDYVPGYPQIRNKEFSILHLPEIVHILIITTKLGNETRYASPYKPSVIRRRHPDEA